MGFIGIGDQDWVELDMDRFDRERRARLRSLLVDQAEPLAAALGLVEGYEVERVDDDEIFLVANGERRFHVDITRGDRLIVTAQLHGDSPL